jgi:NADPH:quinone reductase-like Zn-dependent oxidoreductase
MLKPFQKLTHIQKITKYHLTTMSTMLAAVFHTPGGPEALKLEQRPIPTPKPGQVLIRVKAFGLNRSEVTMLFRYLPSHPLSHTFPKLPSQNPKIPRTTESSKLTQPRQLYTRQGLSPPSAVTLPRILGIECTGLVSSCPGKEFEDGAIVATCMGGMGRLFDGGYAEYCVVPCSQVQVIKTSVNSLRSSCSYKCDS